MPADLATGTAATTAGWTKVQQDRGATANPRYRTHYEKMIAGDAQSNNLQVAEGTSNVSQAAADTAALDALNGFRRHRYGTDATNVNKGPRSGSTHTADVS